jgi:hypothetical protein
MLDAIKMQLKCWITIKMDVEHIQILSRAHQDEADCLRILVTLRRWEWS